MSGGIYMIQGDEQDEQLVEMTETLYDSEDVLQSLLAKYPALLAGEQINPALPRRWLLVRREAALPSQQDGAMRWSVDHLFLDQDGVPTIVEVKRSTDTRIRREVVGQMLEYAANAVVFWPVESLRSWFEASCAQRSQDPEQTILDFLGPAADAEHFWHEVKTNLQAGRVRLIFVADIIPPELRRIVEFLNAQMDPAEVLAVEVRQFAGQGLKTFVPRIIGQSAQAQQKKSSGAREGRQWDEAGFFEALTQKRGREDAATARAILEWAQAKGLRLWWGKGKQDGSFYPMIGPPDDSHYTISVWTYGTVEVQFERMKARPEVWDEKRRLLLLEKLRALSLPVVTFGDDAITRRPPIPLSALKDEKTLRKFLEVLDWIVAEVRSRDAAVP